jgi:hypothetical protein
VEYIMDSPVVREFEPIGNIGYLGNYLERSISSRCQFHCFIWEFQVGAFKLDFVILIEWIIFRFFCHSVLGGF